MAASREGSDRIPFMAQGLAVMRASGPARAGAPKARDLLGPGWFTEGFDTPMLRDAKALLDQLG
jgi:hypothetical protein